MTDYHVDIGAVYPVGAPGGGGGVAFVGSRLTNQGRIYAIIRLTHPSDGPLTLYLGDIGFSLDATGWPYVYAAINNWGSLSKDMGSSDPENEVRIEFLGSAFVVPSNVTKRYRLYDLVRTCQLRDSQVDFFQWDAHLSQSLIWRGYWMGMDNVRQQKGAQIFSARIAARKRSTKVPISDVVNVTGFPKAPPDAMGKMIPRAYGNLQTQLAGGNNGLNDMVFLGYGMRGIPGVVIDEQQDSLKQKVRFVKNDGNNSVAFAPNGETVAPATPSSFFVYIPEANAIGMIDRASIDPSSTAAEVNIVTSLSPSIYVPVRPAEVGSLMHAGLTASAYVATDADPHNLLTTTPTDYTFALNIPALNISGFRVTHAFLVIDVDGDDTIAAGTRTIDWGIWNNEDSSAHGWFGVAGKKATTSVTVGPSRARHILYTPFAAWYTAQDAKHNNGSSTLAEFAEGRFIGRDASDNEIPLQAAISVTSASKDGVRIFGIGVIVKGVIPLDRVRRVSRTVSTPGYDPQGRTGGKFKFKKQVIVEESERIPYERRLDFLAAFDCQQDNGTRYEGGTPNESIKNQAGIAFHLCSEIGGKSCNEAAGTLGNFIDARTEDVANEKNIAPVFGPEVVDLDDALKVLQARFPLRVFNDDGIYQCVPDEMNPHPSRFYRSSTNPIRISARRNIVKDSFRAVELPFEDLRNRATLQYSHVYGTNRPMKTVVFNHPLSQKLMATVDNPTGVLEEPQPFDEPAISIDILNDVYFSGDQPNALFHSRWLGSQKARPRVITFQLLDQSFYDLRRGHVLEYDDDMEGSGIQPIAYRTGLLDYAFVSSTDGTDYADSASPRYIAASGSGEAYWGFSQQISSLTALVATGAGYTTVASGHEWYDGTAWQPHTGVVNADFLKTAGVQTVTVTRPQMSSWKKAELVLGGARRGPCYWWRMKYTAASNQGLGNGVTTYPAKWIGRLFEVISVKRRLGVLKDYPYVDAQLEEVM